MTNVFSDPDYEYISPISVRYILNICSAGCATTFRRFRPKLRAENAIFEPRNFDRKRRKSPVAMATDSFKIELELVLEFDRIIFDVRLFRRLYKTRENAMYELEYRKCVFERKQTSSITCYEIVYQRFVIFGNCVPHENNPNTKKLIVKRILLLFYTGVFFGKNEACFSVEKYAWAYCVVIKNKLVNYQLI